MKIHADKMHRWLLQAKLQERQLKHVVKHEWIQSAMTSPIKENELIIIIIFN